MVTASFDVTVSRADVIAAYRLILGREPENEAVIAWHQRHSSNVAALRRTMLESAEFHLLVPGLRRSPHEGRVALGAPPLAIDTEANQAQLAAILEATATYWQLAGEILPYQSVLTRDEYRPENFPAAAEAFYLTGQDDAKIVEAALARAGRKPEEFRRCVEFGCGVGRVTGWLAFLFTEVVGVDISRAHLQLANEHLLGRGRGNFLLLQATPQAPHPIENGFDLWFSRLVLQHNPAPANLAILDRVFAGLAPRGIAIIGVPVYATGYSFAIDAYLATERGTAMEMHVTPQRAILDLARHH
jgi:2-polyprenyl-3-methyl-5-hydroxy-6-metoxy-1,4-benzoquinol methylase